MQTKIVVTTFYNPAPGNADMNPELLRFCDVICANENEVWEYFLIIFLKFFFNLKGRISRKSPNVK